MDKTINSYKDTRDKILSAVDKIAEPIKSTLSPKGSNVILENEAGNRYVTNDGVTIARAIQVKDPIEDMVIDVIKDSALKTNQEAGDGTSTTILLSSILIKEGLRLIDDGWNRVDVRNMLESGSNKILNSLKSFVYTIKNDKDLKHIALVSASNDKDIADDVFRVVKSAGTEGHIVIEFGNKEKTEIIEDGGFVVPSGLFDESLVNTGDGKFYAEDVPVLVTDKRLYYPEEAETILKTCLNAGHRKVVVVAKDFIGKAPGVFTATHARGSIDICLVKMPSEQYSRYEDLAVYLGGGVVTEKRGKLVDRLTIKDFIIADKVVVDQAKSILLPKGRGSAELALRVKNLKEQIDSLEKDSPEYLDAKRRLGSMTKGMVTIKVGGRTAKELRERIYRYEDAISALLSAMMFGYLPGGGIGLYNAFKQAEASGDLDMEEVNVFRKVCQANIRQIAENCGEHPDTIAKQIDSSSVNYGYNANTKQVQDLLKYGIIDPYKATEMALINAVSVANIIITSSFFILNSRDEEYKAEIKNV